MKRKKISVFIYNSFKDPLFQSNLFKYLVHNQEFGDCEILLITFEQPEYHLTKTEQLENKNRLRRLNIIWRPFNWKKKTVFKMLNFLEAFYLVAKYRFKGYSHIITLGTVAATMATPLCGILNLKHFIYQYEPHFRFLKEAGLPPRNPLLINALIYLEWYAARAARAIATGTSHMVRDLKNRSIKAEIFKVPSCTDESLFRFDPVERNRIRSDLSIGTKKVIIYAGKFGGLYYDDEVFQFISELKALSEDYFFLILTPQEKSKIRKSMKKYSISPDSYYLTKIEMNEIYKWYSAADLGLVTVPPLPLQKYRSPIKTGEYLNCGLPFLVCKGVSDDDQIATEYDVGIVIDELSRESAREVHVEISRFLEEQKPDLVMRCREAGVKYRGFSTLKSIMRKAIIEF